MSPAPGVVAVVAWSGGQTNAPLVEAWRGLGVGAELLSPPEARRAPTLGLARAAAQEAASRAPEAKVVIQDRARRRWFRS